ncbi:MAG: hypothetical protein QM831_21100 [Kofleriaceae bacterium]
MKTWLVMLVAVVGCDSGKQTAPVPPPVNTPPVIAPKVVAVDAGDPPNACTLSVLVDSNGLSIATSDGGCHASTLDWTWLETELRAIKTAHGDCSNAEIAGQGVAYQDLVHGMDVLVKVGYVDVGLTDPNGLTLKPSRAVAPHCDVKPVEAKTPGSGLTLPLADGKTPLKLAPVIVVTKTDVMLDGKSVATIKKLEAGNDNQFMIKPLGDALKAMAAKTLKEMTPEQHQNCDGGKRGVTCPIGLAILQADEATPATVINLIVNTAKDAGYDNLLFAVKAK